MNIKDYGFNEEKYKNIRLFDGEIKLMPARIITTYKNRYEIICDSGKKMAVLKTGCYYDNPNAIYPTVGDYVLINWNDLGEAIIYETLKRESSFSRNASSSDRNHQMHFQHEQLIAANFDYVFIMQSLNDNFNLRRIERYLSMAWESGGIPVVILTKADLVDDTSQYIEKIKDIAIGVDVYAVSILTKDGLNNIEKYFRPRNTIVFLGSSGVGKSSLVNELVGKEIMKTSKIRIDDSEGRHTTTNRQLLMLPTGAMIIDTPGMRELGLWDAEEGVDKTFADIEQYSNMCKYSNCTHTNEPGCKILEAIENGELSRDRYDSYLKLKNELKYNSNSEEYIKNKKNKFKEIAKINKKNKKY